MDGYRQAVAHYADWFKKGLISPDKTIDSNAMNNMLINGDVIMVADYIGGMSGLNYIQRDVGYILYPLQIPQAQGQRRVLGRDLTNFDPLVGHALNGKLTEDPEKLARAIMFLDYLYSDEFVETLWYNDDVTTKNVPADKLDAPLSIRKEYFSWKNDSVYNTSKDYDYTTMNNTYFPWSLCCGFVDIQDERPNPNFDCTAAYIDYRDNVLRAPYKDGYDASTSPYVYGKNPTVLLTAEEQKRVLHYEASITDIYKTNIAAFCEGKKNFENDWNEFINTMMQSGGEEMIQIYNNAYSRAE
jgi:ABC-type glycerol-3-phosphate transport system substrate-binding protein